MGNKHPGREECFQLLKNYETPAHVVRHCTAVTDVAMAIGQALNEHGFSLDLGLIQGAGLIHDIARVEDKHWEVGSQLAASCGYYQEAKIIQDHMFYSFVNKIDDISEMDLVCLGDRLVKEDEYVGLKVRMEYVLEKTRQSGNLQAEEIIRVKIGEAEHLIKQVETAIGTSLEELMKKKGLA